MRLQGVAKEAVMPHGETDVVVKLGAGPGFVERVAVVDELPGGVSVLVGFDTIEKLGLHVSKESVVLGGETCKRVEQADSGSAGAVSAAELERIAGKEAKAKMKQLKAELRENDPLFRKLESQGLIEEVIEGPGASLDDPRGGVGYRAKPGALEKAVSVTFREAGPDGGQGPVNQRARVSTKALKRAERVAKLAKKEAKQARKDREWAKELAQLDAWQEERQRAAQQEIKDEMVCVRNTSAILSSWLLG